MQRASSKNIKRHDTIDGLAAIVVVVILWMMHASGTKILSFWKPIDSENGFPTQLLDPVALHVTHHPFSPISMSVCMPLRSHSNLSHCLDHITLKIIRFVKQTPLSQIARGSRGSCCRRRQSQKQKGSIGNIRNFEGRIIQRKSICDGIVIIVVEEKMDAGCRGCLIVRCFVSVFENDVQWGTRGGFFR